VIEKQIRRGAGNEGGELLEEFDGLEEEVGCAITPRGLEFDEDAPVGAEPDAVLGEGGPEEIAAELLQAARLLGGTPDVGMQGEAVELFLTRAARGNVTEVRLVAEAPDAGAGARTEGDAALDGGAHETGEDGRGLGEWVSGRAVVVRLELTTSEEPSDPRADGGEDVHDVGVARWACGVEGNGPNS
jgi:hypothetical protein